MMRQLFALLCFCGLSVILTACGGGTVGTGSDGNTVVTGRLFTSDSKAVANATVTILETGDSGTVDEQGRFEILAVIDSSQLSFLVTTPNLEAQDSLTDVPANPAAIAVDLELNEVAKTVEIKKSTVKPRSSSSSRSGSTSSKASSSSQSPAQVSSAESSSSSVTADPCDNVDTNFVQVDLLNRTNETIDFGLVNLEGSSCPQRGPFVGEGRMGEATIYYFPVPRGEAVARLLVQKSPRVNFRFTFSNLPTVEGRTISTIGRFLVNEDQTTRQLSLSLFEQRVLIDFGTEYSGAAVSITYSPQ